MPDLTTIKDVSIVVAGVATLAGFLAALAEYVRQNGQRRAQHFVDLRRRFLETAEFRPILAGLDNDVPELAHLPLQDRRNFLGFLEEVGLMTESGLVRPEVTHIMFGRYIALADRSRHLWQGLNRQETYWAIFRRLAEAERNWQGRPDPRNFRF